MSLGLSATLALADPDETSPSSEPTRTERFLPPITNADWESMGGYPGFGHLHGGGASIRTMVVDEHTGDIYVGGIFDYIGTLRCKNIARWDGAQWHPVGEGIDSFVVGLALSSTGKLYALTSRRGSRWVLHWDGGEWISLGFEEGAGRISNLETFVLDDLDNLYVGGDFVDAAGVEGATNVARWDGAEWHALGLGLSDAVYALALAADGDLIAGGTSATPLPLADDATEHSVHRWDGTKWSPVGTNLSGTVSSLLSVPNGDLVCAGTVLTIEDAGGIVSSDRVGRWDGTRWQPMGLGTAEGQYFSGNLVRGLELWDEKIVAYGTFTDVEGNPDWDYLLRWTGTTWERIPGPEHDVDQFLGLDAESFLSVNWVISPEQFPVYAPQRWDSGGIRIFGSGPGFPNSNAIYAPDHQGGIYAVSGFYNIQPYEWDHDSKLLHWQDTQWEIVADMPEGFARVKDCVVDHQGIVYLACLVREGDHDDGETFSRVYTFDGTAWSKMLVLPELNGTFLYERETGFHLSLDISKRVVVESWTKDANAPPLVEIIYWDSPTGPRSLPETPPEVTAIGFDAWNRLYIGGLFEDAGGNPDADYAARWDGRGWQAIGKGPSDPVYALEVDSMGSVYAFTAAEYDWYSMRYRLEHMAASQNPELSAWEVLETPAWLSIRDVSMLCDAASRLFLSYDSHWHAIYVREQGTFQSIMPDDGPSGNDISSILSGSDGSLFAAGEFEEWGGVVSKNCIKLNLPAGSNPRFVDDPLGRGEGATPVRFAVGDGAWDIGPHVQVVDGDEEQTLTWTVLEPPEHGVLDGFPVTTSSNGWVVIPDGLTYTPTSTSATSDRFTVMASDGLSSQSLVVRVEIAALAAPTELTATLQPDGIVQLAWVDNATMETGYAVERQAGAEAPWTAIAELSANSNEFLDTEAPSGQSVSYRVRALRAEP